MNPKFSLTLIFILSGFISVGQTLERPTFSIGGGFLDDTAVGSLSFTIGEPVITTIGNGQNIFTQGFQQPSPFEYNNDYVWPGDADKNGLVNMNDHLKWGIAFGTSGPARAYISTAWEYHQSYDWLPAFIDGINYKHADFNGDGTIDSVDISAIHENYNDFDTTKQQGISPLTMGGSIALGMPNCTDSLRSIPIDIDMPTLPGINGIYGVSATFKITSIRPVNIDDVRMVFENSWFGNPDMNFIGISRVFEIDDNIYVAIGITGTDALNRIGNGTVGFIEIEDNISQVVGVPAYRAPKIEDNISQVTVNAIDKVGNAVPMHMSSPLHYSCFSSSFKMDDESQENAIINRPKGSQNIPDIPKQNAAEFNVNIYPNPTTGALNIHLSGGQPADIRVSDMTGKSLMKHKAINRQARLYLDKLPAGVYIITITTKHGLVVKRVVKI